MKLPPVILYVNQDISASVEQTLVTQLYIHEVIDGYEFDDRVIADPNYPDELRFNELRVLVKRDFSDYTNRELADVAIFVKYGLAAIEESKYGPPGLTLPVANLYIYRLINNA